MPSLRWLVPGEWSSSDEQNRLLFVLLSNKSLSSLSNYRHACSAMWRCRRENLQIWHAYPLHSSIAKFLRCVLMTNFHKKIILYFNVQAYGREYYLLLKKEKKKLVSIHLLKEVISFYSFHNFFNLSFNIFLNLNFIFIDYLNLFFMIVFQSRTFMIFNICFIL